MEKEVWIEEAKRRPKGRDLLLRMKRAEAGQVTKLVTEPVTEPGVTPNKGTLREEALRKLEGRHLKLLTKGVGAGQMTEEGMMTNKDLTQRVPEVEMLERENKSDENSKILFSVLL
eukprot:GFUD01028969.1.p2 GENE.GFUD01028969.1~~GFUD01028969.1.p2  ORF type:complete len:116 (-),score=32.42 GFUD01028969.1:27-374(-)